MLVYGHSYTATGCSGFYGRTLRVAAWETFSVPRNRAPIRKACDTLGVSDRSLPHLYSWLLLRHLAD